MDNYSGHEDFFSVDTGLINKGKNITALNDHKSTVLNSIFVFKQVTGQNIEPLS